MSMPGMCIGLESCTGPVCLAFMSQRVGRRRCRASEPPLHELDLVVLRQRDALAQDRDVGTRAVALGPIGHDHGLGVVHDHHLHEPGVGRRVVGLAGAPPWAASGAASTASESRANIGPTTRAGRFRIAVIDIPTGTKAVYRTRRATAAPREAPDAGTPSPPADGRGMGGWGLGGPSAIRLQRLHLVRREAQCLEVDHAVGRMAGIAGRPRRPLTPWLTEMYEVPGTCIGIHWPLHLTPIAPSRSRWRPSRPRSCCRPRGLARAASGTAPSADCP